MANLALSISNGSIASGVLPFLFYDSVDQSKPQPLILFLHGAGEGSPNGGPHNTTTVRALEDSGHGLMTLTKTASLPTFTHPTTGEEFDYYMIAPQQYYPAGTNRGNGIIWPQVYITECIKWAIANRNIDTTRIYITGLSLGGGGTIDMIMKPAVRNLFAAAACACPGYGNGTTLDHAGFAKTGFPLWIVAAYDDFVPQGTNTICTQIINRMQTLSIPLRPVKFYWYLSGGHGIWYRLYDVRDGISYPGFNSEPCVHHLSMFRWFLLSQRLDTIAPIYI